MGWLCSNHPLPWKGGEKTGLIVAVGTWLTSCRTCGGDSVAVPSQNTGFTSVQGYSHNFVLVYLICSFGLWHTEFAADYQSTHKATTNSFQSNAMKGSHFSFCVCSSFVELTVSCDDTNDACIHIPLLMNDDD